MSITLSVQDPEIIASIFLPEYAKVYIYPNHPINDGYKDNTVISHNNSLVCPEDTKILDHDYIVDFKNELKSNSHQALRISYINNPDGSIRWMYPEANSFPGFLNFYNGSTIKAKIYTRLVQTAFNIGLKNVVRSGVFTLMYRKTLNPLITEITTAKTDFSVFTGTKGVSRKIQIEVHDTNQTLYFIKLPFTEFSRELIFREKIQLANIKSLNLSFMKTPAVMEKGNACMLYSENIKTSNVHNSSVFSDLHLYALDELYANTIHHSEIHSLKCITESREHLEWLNRQAYFKFDKRLLSGLNLLFQTIDKDQMVSSARAHKDFTPWNMYRDEQSLYVFDWEASAKNIPLLFDFFHFHFQTGILIHQQSFAEIIDAIQKKLKEPEFEFVIAKYAINTDLHLALYLMLHVTEYLVLYQKQESLHMQVEWLTNTWKDAIHFVNIKLHKEHMRQYVIQDFISSVSDLNYAWMKYKGKKLSAISEETDMDLLIDREDLPAILKKILAYGHFAKIRYVRKSFMTTVNMYFHNQEFLSIDLIYAFKRNHYWYLDPAKILAYTDRNKDGVKVPQLHHDFEYILLFYTLNSAPIPDKYQQQFNALSDHEQSGILKYINDRFDTSMSSLNEWMINNLILRLTLMSVVQGGFTQNSFVRIIHNRFVYIGDMIKESVYNKGFVMTISGVDGAGKSTVIESLKSQLENKFRKKVVVLRHRPSLFPILSSYVYGKKEAEQKAADTLPRQGTNRNVLSSFLRFGYYFMDYQIGQVYVFFKHVCRGRVVIYDRYYFDFIQDGKRTNIHLPTALTGFLYHFIYKPRLNVLLYADPKVILARKQELTEQEITEMTYSYRQLFSKLSKRYDNDVYLTIENIHKRTTINRIIENYCEVA